MKTTKPKIRQRRTVKEMVRHSRKTIDQQGVRDHPDPFVYIIEMEEGSTLLTDWDGNILWDQEDKEIFPPYGARKVFGLAKRLWSSKLVALSRAADGAEIGEGWVRDQDDLELPRNRDRAVSVRRVVLAKR